MATVTTNNYLQYPAEAYNSIAAQFSGLTNLADGTTFSASYANSGGTNGARLTLEVTDFGGLNHRVMNAYMSSIQPGIKIPCRMALSFGTLISQKQISPGAGAVNWTVTQLMGALMPAVYTMLEDITDGIAVPTTLQDITWGSNPRPMIAWQGLMMHSTNDMMICVFAWVDQSMSNNTLLNTTPLYIPVATNGISNFFSQSSSGSETLDLDVAINNGASIFSVVSKTFTEP